jgi:phytoene dehydrogenase-like protein
MSNGGMILDNAHVSKILIKDETAYGVELEDGQKITAKAVASSVDPPQTLLKLVGREHLSEDLVKSAENWKWEEESLFCIHLDLNEPPKYKADDPTVNEALVNLIGFETVDDIFKHLKEIDAGELPTAPAAYCCCPTLFDPSQAPPGKHVGYIAVWAPYELKDGGAEKWDKVRDKYMEKILDYWREYAPNLTKEKILGKYAYTPLDIERKLIDMVKGSYKQGSYVSYQMGYFRPNMYCSQYRTPIKGLYMCGSGVYPGGMITFGPGYNAANVIVEDLGLKKFWSEPEYVTRARKERWV